MTAHFVHVHTGRIATRYIGVNHPHIDDLFVSGGVTYRIIGIQSIAKNRIVCLLTID